MCKIRVWKKYISCWIIYTKFYETFITEKVNDCFLTGTIPIYLGAPDIGDYYNLDGIIVMDIDKDGTVYHKGVEQPKLKGTLEPTKVKKPKRIVKANLKNIFKRRSF